MMRKMLFFIGGAERARTAGLIRARDALSQTELLPHEFDLIMLFLL